MCQANATSVNVALTYRIDAENYSNALYEIMPISKTLIIAQFHTNKLYEILKTRLHEKYHKTIITWKKPKSSHATAIESTFKGTDILD